MKQDSSQVIMILLAAVVMSSLTLLVFGLNPEPGPAEILQIPVTLAQLLFILAVALRVGAQNIIAPLTVIQRSLIGALFVYVFFVSLTSQVPSAPMLASTWLVHILFLVALVSFFSHVRPSQINTIWMVLGIAGFLHVCAFLIAWSLWPERIRQGSLPAFDNIRHLGYLLAPAGAAMAVHFVTRLDRLILSLLCFSAAIFYILYTGSRGGAVALAAGLTVTGAFLAWHRTRVHLLHILILLGVTGVTILASELLPALPWKPVFGRGVDAIGQTGTEMLSGRSHVWAAAMSAIEQNLLWGYGPAIMGQIPAYQGVPLRHPHNIGLQLLLHWGVLGTFITLTTVLSFLPNIWIALRNQPGLTLMPLAVLTTMCIHALVDGSLFYQFSTVAAIIAFAHLDAIGRQSTALQENAAFHP